jgi:uncharacterized protein YlaI
MAWIHSSYGMWVAILQQCMCSTYTPFISLSELPAMKNPCGYCDTVPYLQRKDEDAAVGQRLRSKPTHTNLIEVCPQCTLKAPKF